MRFFVSLFICAGALLARWRLYALLAVVPHLVLAGCASMGGPDRLVPVDTEMGEIRSLQLDFATEYYAAIRSNTLDKAQTIRNEIIAERMYAIDVQYSQYEAALTHESQKVGFAALTTAEGLSTAATIVTPVLTKTILSGLTTAIVATKGHYDSEVLLALTMRTIQKQMRASRNKISAQINSRMSQSVKDYPLSAALSDIEEYYRAGTLTTGVIDTSTTVGIQEKEAEQTKQAVTQVALAARPAALLSSSTAPIPTPVILPVLHPNAIGFYEQHLLPVRLSELAAGVCVATTGNFDNDLVAVRTAMLQYFADVKAKDSNKDWKDKTVPNGITNKDRIKLKRNPKNCA